MIIYLYLYMAFLVSAFLDFLRKYTVRRGFLFLALASATLVLAFRFGVGSDYFSYERIFWEINEFSKFNGIRYEVDEKTPVESGFALFMWVIKSLFDRYEVFVAILAVISIYLKYKVFSRLSPYVALSFLIYFCDEWFWKDLSGARSALASTLILFAVYYVYYRRLIGFLLVMSVAVLVHASAVIAIPLYFIRYVSNAIYMTVALGASVLIAYLGGLGQFLSQIALSLGAPENSRIVKYADSIHAEGISAFGGTFLIHLAICIYLIFYRNHITAVWGYNRILIPMYVYGSCLMFSVIDFGILSGRIRELLCIPALAVLFPSFILMYRGNERFVLFFAVIAYSALWFYLMMVDRTPYQYIGM